MKPILVGSHASMLLENKENNLTKLEYNRGDVFQKTHSEICLNGHCTIATGDYDLTNLTENLGAVSSIESSNPVVLLGDPSELLMQAAIEDSIKKNTLSGVMFLYPVGMTALDLRKEIASSIHQLKANNIPTYLCRDTESFFSDIEPNVNAFVHSLEQDVRPNSSIEYLCGAKRLESLTV